MKRLAVATLAVTSLFFASAALAAEPGDFVSSASSNDSYMVTDASSRLAFPDDLTLQSWGQPELKKVEDGVLNRFRVKGTVPLRQGSNLVRFGTDPDVYAVGPNGVLHQIAQPSVAEKLYGSDWAKKVVSLFTSFWVNYKFGSVVDSASSYPEGTLLKYAGSPKVYYLTNGLIRPFASEAALKANHFNLKSVITIPDSVKYLVGNAIAGFERGLSDVPAK